MNEEENEYYEAQQAEYESQFGACPNCGATAHVTDLGKEVDGQVCCVNCYKQYREKLPTPKS